MSKRFTFKGGVHPPHKKSQTEHLSIEVFPAPQKVIIPLQQHIGAPAKAVVNKGDHVVIGQLLGEAGGFVSAPVHSSVSGTVLSVGLFPHPTGKPVMAVEIENDGLDERMPFEPGKPWAEADSKELISRIQAAGIVGMGGASFPTHVKLSPPEGKKIDTVIVNGVECEPYLTADHRSILERTDAFLTGALIIKKILNAGRCFIAIEDNKQDAIKSVRSRLSDAQFKGELKIAVLQTKYPQGGEKQLINAVTGRMVPSGGLPMDSGCVVPNAGTTLAVYDAVVEGIPLYQRVLTVTGPTAAKPRNFLVRIGTPIRLLIEACEVDMKATRKIIMGGPMMGITQSDLDVPVIKSTSGILAYDKVVSGEREYPCINCGHCVHACPIHLVPSRLAKLVNKEKYDEALEWNITDCMECGSCAFVCPSKINLVHYMKLGKFHIQARRAAAAKK
ncbi:MAG: electron transport complex subunit RsxC [Fibrobacter sp.]|nr:electron transport complex subunit RsxC [Fibrobacter sp.]